MTNKIIECNDRISNYEQQRLEADDNKKSEIEKKIRDVVTERSLYKQKLAALKSV